MIDELDVDGGYVSARVDCMGWPVPNYTVYRNTYDLHKNPHALRNDDTYDMTLYYDDTYDDLSGRNPIRDPDWHLRARSSNIYANDLDRESPLMGIVDGP